MWGKNIYSSEATPEEYVLHVIMGWLSFYEFFKITRDDFLWNSSFPAPY